MRKASGSPQTGFDPEMSEWGNPPLHRWLSLRQQQKRPCAKRVGGLRVMCEGVSRSEYIGAWRRTEGTETSKYLEEKKSTEIPKVVASEMGRACKR